jgi:hypothetical protein
VLGDFDARKGEKYRISIRVRHIAPQLGFASPHVRVEAGRIYWEQWVIFAQLTLLFGAVAGIPGIALLLIGLLSKRRVLSDKAVPSELPRTLPLDFLRLFLCGHRLHERRF